jgi:hypothetical protein
MNFEEIQQMWGRQDNGGRIVIDADVLLKEVRRNQRQFASTIFWRDFREVGVAILMVFYFGRHGLRAAGLDARADRAGVLWRRDVHPGGSHPAETAFSPNRRVSARLHPSLVGSNSPPGVAAAECLLVVSASAPHPAHDLSPPWCPNDDGGSPLSPRHRIS